MDKKTVDKRKIQWLSILVFFVIICVGIFFMPKNVITHFDFTGTADAVGPKATLLIFVLVPLILGLITELLLKLLKKQYNGKNGELEIQEYEKNVNLITTISLIVVLAVEILSVVLFIIIFILSGKTDIVFDGIGILNFMLEVFAVLFTVSGVFMPKAKRGGAFGIRCSWSNYNQTTWERSNLYSGIACIILGAVMLIAVIFLQELASMVASCVALFVFAFVPTFVSLIIAHRVYIKECGK